MASDKVTRLQRMLREMGSVLVAFSGGVDSTFLLKMAHMALGDEVLAVTAVSPIHPDAETRQAQRLAKQLGVSHLFVHSGELQDRQLVRNDPQRCYYCKRNLFTKLVQLAGEKGLQHTLDGSNHNDLKDYRPGAQAIYELGIRSPLQEVGLTKTEIRELSRQMGLDTWDKPAMACLASRIPYGMPLREKDLKMVEEAERTLRGQGFRQVRVRHHMPLARIEVGGEEMERIISHRDEIVSGLKALGYAYVTLDLKGYRAGSMNEVLSEGGGKK